MAEVGILQELELHYVTFDTTFINILKGFDKLEMLFIDCKFGNESSSLTEWPPNLKRLYLFNVTLPINTFISIIPKLKYLEIVEVYIEHVRDICASIFFKKILECLDDKNRKQQLHVILAWPALLCFEGEDPGVSCCTE